MANPSDNELSELEQELQKERAHRDVHPEASDAELEPSYERSDAIEERMLLTAAVGAAGFLVKLREIRYQLQNQGTVLRRLDSLERDVAAAAAVERELSSRCPTPF